MDCAHEPIAFIAFPIGGQAIGSAPFDIFPLEVVESCGLTYAMLSTPSVAHEVYEMGGGLLSGVQDGKAIVDCATLTPERMAAMSSAVKAAGGSFLEAPVSGSKGPAEAGQLIFLTAGDAAVKEAAEADLEAMGKATFYFGEEVGRGSKMKLVVNMIMVRHADS